MHRAWCICLAFLLFILPLLTCANEPPYYQSEEFNEGEYGNYPRRHYKTTTISPPRPNIMRNFSNCDDGSYIFVAPRGHQAKASFFILDHKYVALQQLGMAYR